MTSTKYIGLDVHKESISIAVLNSAGKVVMECVIETKASTILQFIHGLRGDVHLTFEEGTWAGWLYDLLKPHVTELVVCNPRKNALLKEGSKSDRIDARKLAELLYMSKLSSVYHGIDSRPCIGAGPFPVPGRKSTHRIIVRNGSPRFTKQACAGGQNFTTNNSTPCGWCANKPGKSCWPRRGSTVRRSCYGRFLVLVRFGRLTWWR